MFALARDRFGRRGQFASLASAYAAAQAAPDALSVQDYRHRTDLLAGKFVSVEETGAAVDASPADNAARFTHALALLKAGRSGDAMGVFCYIDIFLDGLPPPRTKRSPSLFSRPMAQAKMLEASPVRSISTS